MQVQYLHRPHQMYISAHLRACQASNESVIVDEPRITHLITRPDAHPPQLPPYSHTALQPSHQQYPARMIVIRGCAGVQFVFRALERPPKAAELEPVRTQGEGCQDARTDVGMPNIHVSRPYVQRRERCLCSSGRASRRGEKVVKMTCNADQSKTNRMMPSAASSRSPSRPP